MLFLSASLYAVVTWIRLYSRERCFVMSLSMIFRYFHGFLNVYHGTLACRTVSWFKLALVRPFVSTL